MTVVGVISDTHGLLRPQVLVELQGVDLIIHAGDVGSPDILPALRKIAPVTVVRGNIDKSAWCEHFPANAIIPVEETSIYMLHNFDELDLDPLAAGFAAVVYGHSHKPLIERRRSVLYLNPGSCGPRRFSLPITMARAVVNGSSIEAELIHLPE